MATAIGTPFRTAYWNERNNVNGENPHSKQKKTPSLPLSNCDYDDARPVNTSAAGRFRISSESNLGKDMSLDSNISMGKWVILYGMQ